ncbi:hypothetical protein KFK09_011654 [Dendrobium nobile]|uniref:Protein kinase domain-containing protein n=1 Tax=Dendrobium nobile TaxID=94219 RepID=A0A8T3BDH0_DENNO|nr:hypothetical protein KFK09_011654 [Dendrobium nobile]
MPSSFKLFFFLIFLSYIEIILSHGRGSCSSSCGNLQNIRYPFHLRGDPTECGGPDFELNCEGNNTVLEIHRKKFYVIDISYRDSEIMLVDVGLAKGNCVNLPERSVNPDDYLGVFRFGRAYIGQATFINCSVKIDDPSYKIVPCLSKNNSQIFYALFEILSVGHLPVNCHFLYTVPLNDNRLQHSIFDQLKLGFRINWTPLINSTADAIHNCAKIMGNLVFIDGQSTESYKEEMGITLYDLISPFRFEIDFLACLHKEQYKNSILTYYAAAVIFLVLDITLLILVLLIIGRFLFAPLCVLSFLTYNLFKLSVPVDIIERFLQNQKALSPSRYSYNDIITITSNFKEKLGQGGFGSVYKGRLPGGYLVAVKMLGKSMGDGEDFINEVSTIGRIHHVNVVQLVGFCAEGSYRALVYEYMANGSLDKYIFSSNKENRILNMDKLLEIALSVAKGLHYLHQGCNMGILHFDIKPHNILLDHKFTPKISDFGLAKLHPKDHSLVFMSAARGTIGYIAPELISRSFGTISHKSDVYSFGMLLMDMAGGRRHNDLKAENSSQVYYPSWIYDKLQKRELSENFEIFEIDDLEMKLCKVGLCCIQTRPVDRPSMINVVEMLEADVNSLQMPPKPFFSSSHSMSQRNICMDYSVHELPIILENL